ncbi:glutamate ABC transporter substrate-binding protein [Corynebacterium lizhenjunii]|uniref:Glutamate ABC transporter substrate-binding protein n=1 Tax=Corynebacterium lizhenjunii TaxID=2709394 RepID=A0A7T0KDS7_9CORY|nr:glutamate ABC transporter substrate-binding protein [Corynebacterium lizhenjunii]QPK78936.1 glutamate ABC transporter substrate-binding protein [Corynebacterium lizhenjunii]
MSMWHWWRAQAAAGALCIAAVCAAGCASAPEPADGFISSNDAPVGRPLPAGSELLPAAEFADSWSPTEYADLRGSLRPDDAAPQQRVESIHRRGRIIVGVDQSNNLLSYRDTQSGQLQGFEVDLAREIARDIFDDPDKVDFRFVTSAERADALQSGLVDVIIRSMSITPQRQEELEFSLPYLATSTRLLVLKNSGITGVEDLAERTACAAAGSTSLGIVGQRAPGATALATRNWGDCLMALQMGQVDAVVTDDALLSGMAAQDSSLELVGVPLSTEYYGVAVRKPDHHYDSRGLIRQVNSTLERVRRDGTWQRSFTTWFGPYLQPTPLPAPNYREEDN